MHGNVWEWVLDRYSLYSAEDQLDPRGPSSGGFRVIRSGDFESHADWVRAAKREGWEPVSADPALGFRAVFPVTPRDGSR